MSQRRILRLSGPDTRSFLQGLVTNDLSRIDQGLVYAAMLTPQGKYLADFFLLAEGEDVLLDVAAELADGLSKRLTMYRLRANVEITDSDRQVARGTGPAPASALGDPRHGDMGWRLYGGASGDDGSDWDAIRVAHIIPETGIELTPDSFILELGFEALNGVDFRKGCYVGQEVTARMKHKTTLRKGLCQVDIDGQAAPGTAIMADGKVAGTLFTQSGPRALAYLRFDRASGDMQADAAVVRWTNPG
ncbi:CAF17-like 4Fe-4S cluster assembly/insertion protein YgfZ [Parasedimentitalea psychrophila]|uniref:Folate-binding protein n=1 Tax=Parasedimentitalea psychrophila TaxID=2997337 RepID=A0A9Y2KYK7_9RHOB|nr:folate-binding protein [Parasedimentitalea psychrophila]WIY23539.1 folate-binding protein [Parasedimentitalea psychrophila]